jgi:hypothetical protein
MTRTDPCGPPADNFQAAGRVFAACRDAVAERMGRMLLLGGLPITARDMITVGADVLSAPTSPGRRPITATSRERKTWSGNSAMHRHR